MTIAASLTLALVVWLLFRYLGQDRRIYPCTMCSLGCIWRGGRWLHADGRFEVPDEPIGDVTHPPIPIQF